MSARNAPRPGYRHEVRWNGKRVGDVWDDGELALAFAHGFQEGSVGVEPEIVSLDEKSTGIDVASFQRIGEAKARGFVSGEMMARRGELGPEAQRVLTLREHEHGVLVAALVHRLCDDGYPSIIGEEPERAWSREAAARIEQLFPNGRKLASANDRETLARALVARLRREGSIELASAVAAALRDGAPPASPPEGGPA